MTASPGTPEPALAGTPWARCRVVNDENATGTGRGVWLYVDDGEGEVQAWGHVSHIDGPLSPDAEALLAAINAWAIDPRSDASSTSPGSVGDQ